MRKTYLPLSDEDRNYLKSLSKKRTIQAQVVDRARILLYKADGMTFQEIADKLAISTATVRLCVSKFHKGGVDAALFDVQRPGCPSEITDDTTTTKPSEAKTPTYPLQIHKSIKDNKDSYLAGAIFRLYKTEQDAKANTNPIAVTGSNGSYTVDLVQSGDNKQYDMESIGDGTTVSKGMNLKLNGLAAGDYWLVETKAPDGYSGITAPIKITIIKSNDTDEGKWTIKKDTVVEGDKIIDIENSAGTLLPGTGGMGTILFTVVGVALILVVAASFVISRRKRA